MTSRTVATALLAVGCLTAAAGGSYLAVRHNAAEASAIPATAEPAATPEPDAVSDTEGRLAPEPGPAPDPVAPSAAPPAVEPEPEIERAPAPRLRPEPRPAARPVTRRASAAPARETTQAAGREPAPAAPGPAATVDIVPPAVPVAPDAHAAELPIGASIETPVEPLFTEITVPASAVIGLEIETTVSSEKAMIEDRVEARVTRDVYAEGRLAIPAGSRAIGAVTLVEKGGKLKERARLGVRFHTLVLADGQRLPMRTETILREGDSPGAESSRKIGGAAIGGAVLGAILGGGKGAVTGATVGAAGGTAAVMAGGRNPATLAGGSVVTVRLASPITLEVGR